MNIYTQIILIYFAGALITAIGYATFFQDFYDSGRTRESDDDRGTRRLTTGLWFLVVPIYFILNIGDWIQKTINWIGYRLRKAGRDFKNGFKEIKK